MYIYMNLYGFFSLNVKKAFIEDIDEIGIHIYIYMYIYYILIYIDIYTCINNMYYILYIY